MKGLYQTFNAWFATGQNGNGHEKPWYYWLMLIGRYEAAVALGLLACLFCQLLPEHERALSRDLRGRHAHGLQHRSL